MSRNFCSKKSFWRENWTFSPLTILKSKLFSTFGAKIQSLQFFIESLGQKLCFETVWLMKPKIFFASHWLLYSFLFYNACNGSIALVAVCVRSLYLEAAHIPLRKVKISWEKPLSKHDCLNHWKKWTYSKSLGCFGGFWLGNPVQYFREMLFVLWKIMCWLE